MNQRTQWDEDFLSNLQKGFEPLAKNEFTCIIMEADSSLMWILLRNEITKSYQLIWKINYQTWKNITSIAMQYNKTHREARENNCICHHVPVGNVLLQNGDKGWLFSGTFAYFIRSIQEADKNILKSPSIV